MKEKDLGTHYWFSESLAKPVDKPISAEAIMNRIEIEKQIRHFIFSQEDRLNKLYA